MGPAFSIAVMVLGTWRMPSKKGMLGNLTLPLKFGLFHITNKHFI